MTMMTPASCTVSTFSELEDFLLKLGSPPKGTIRVYRGQVREYYDSLTGRPILLPASARPNNTDAWNPAWGAVVMAQVASLGLYESSADWRNSAVWIPALLQHYGAGSPYLDVTSDLFMALWFSLHERHEKRDSRHFELDAQTFIEGFFSIAWYTKLPDKLSSEQPPVIYVFDVEPWSGAGIPTRAQLVDLLALPQGSKLSNVAKRLKVQSASLLQGFAHKPEDSDLYDTVRAIIRLGEDFVRSAPRGTKLLTLEVFPPAAQDAIYKTIQHIPSRLCVNPLRLEHPLSIPIYLDADPSILVTRSASSFVDKKTSPYRVPAFHFEPILFHRFLLSQSADLAQTVGILEVADQKFYLRDATPMILEEPIWVLTPGVDTEDKLAGWIQSALPLCITDKIANQRTDSVYVELSSLDLMLSHGPDTRVLLRGVWLIRQGLNYVITLYGLGPQFPVSATVRFRYEQGKGVFGVLEKGQWKPKTLLISNNPKRIINQATKSLLVILTMLRDLSPGYKPPPMHGMELEGVFLTRTLIEPQLGNAQVEKIGSTTYLIPKTISGETYKCQRVSLEDTEEPENPEQVLELLDNLFPKIKDPFYLIALGKTLTQAHLGSERIQRAHYVVKTALDAARSVKSCQYLDEVDLEAIHGRILAKLGDHNAACEALRRSLSILRAHGLNTEASTLRYARIGMQYVMLGCDPEKGIHEKL